MRARVSWPSSVPPIPSDFCCGERPDLGGASPDLDAGKADEIGGVPESLIFGFAIDGHAGDKAAGGVDRINAVMFHRTISNIWRQRPGKAFSQVIISSHVN